MRLSVEIAQATELNSKSSPCCSHTYACTHSAHNRRLARSFSLLHLSARFCLFRLCVSFEPNSVTLALEESARVFTSIDCIEGARVYTFNVRYENTYGRNDRNPNIYRFIHPIENERAREDRQRKQHATSVTMAKR